MELLPAIDLRAGSGGAPHPGRLRPRGALRRPRCARRRATSTAAPAGSTSSTSTAPAPGVPHERDVLRHRSSSWPVPRTSAWSSAAASAPRTMPRRCSSPGWRESCSARRPSRSPRWRAAAPAAGRDGWPSGSTTGSATTGWPRPRRRAGWPGRVSPSTDLLELWAKEPIGAVVATSVARDGMLSGPDLAGLAALLAATSLPVVASGGVAGVADLVALAGLEVSGAAWPARSWARRSSRAASAWRRGSPRAQRPPDPLPRRHRRPRRQGRAIRRPDRRGRPGGAGRPLRRRGRRRGDVPRHHRLVGRARHDGRRSWRARPSRSSSP